jgi:hypothetical protein
MEKFEELIVSTLQVKQPKANEKAGKSAYVDRADGLPTQFTLEKSSKLLKPIRPGSNDGTIKEHERLNMEVNLTKQEESKALECDEHFLKSLFAMKVDCFGPSKAKAITSIDALKPMYKNLLHEGGEYKGVKYDNYLRLKVDGWASYIKKGSFYSAGHSFQHNT